MTSPVATGKQLTRGGTGRVLSATAAIVSLIVLLDQGTKIWATRTLSGRPPVAVFENFFHFSYHRNTGGVFGLLAGPPSTARQFFFIAATVIALAFIFYLVREWGRESRLAFFGLSLVGGGAVGNLIDRLVYGEVVDFIDWHWHGHHWPTFNVADSFIVAGTILLVLSMLRPQPPPRGES